MNISIIVPVYNAELYLKRFLDSLVKNKQYIYETLLIDDGSTDNSANICKKYANKYKFIKYIYQKNQGPSAARNKGLDMANGKYIVFIDSDDYIGDIKNVVDTINNNNNVDYFIFPNIYKDINSKIESVNRNYKFGIFEMNKNKIIIKKMIKDECINAPWSKIYKKEIIDKYNIRFDKRYKLAEDLLFNISYISKCNNFIIGKCSFYFYCFNGANSLTQKYFENKYNMLMEVNQELKKYFDDMKISMENYLIYKNIYSSIKNLHHRDCPLSQSEKVDTIKKFKKEHNKKIIFDCGLKMMIWSTIFSIFPANLIYRLT